MKINTAKISGIGKGLGYFIGKSFENGKYFNIILKLSLNYI